MQNGQISVVYMRTVFIIHSGPWCSCGPPNNDASIVASGPNLGARRGLAANHAATDFSSGRLASRQAFRPPARAVARS